MMLFNVGVMQIWLVICVSSAQIFIAPTIGWVYSVFGISGGAEPATPSLASSSSSNTVFLDPMRCPRCAVEAAQLNTISQL
jgi:hypothetical protein